MALTKEQLARALELTRELKRRRMWSPLPGPQSDALQSEADITGFGGAAGGGKGLALDTPLPTPTGWTTMGDVQPGDWLLDDHGQPCRVLYTSPIQHRDCYRLRLDDGAEVVADDVHRWKTEQDGRPLAITDTLALHHSLLTPAGAPRHWVVNHGAPAGPAEHSGPSHWHRAVVSCERVQSVPTRCISVSSPNRMFLAGRGFIPTHNTDLACGLALTKHEKTMILRENGTELTGVIDRLTELLGGRDGYNGQDKIWRTTTPDGKPRQIEFGSYPNPGDEAKYQGRPHDLLVYDEAANHRESAVRFLMGWLRTTTPGQRCRALLTFNPPTTAEGRWIIDFFGPWLNKKHPNPAKPGELRWFATIAGKDIEVPDNRPFILKGDKRVYLFDPEQHRPEEIVKPMSRTFIPSRVSNNPYLMGTGYVTTLQALPEPLRSQMLNGDFNAGIQDDPWQVIPTAWVEAAMARWQPKLPKPPMDSMGVDVARGGKDNTVLSPRHGNWYDELITYPGSATPNGPQTAGLVIAATRDNAPIHIDVIGVGSSPYDFLREANQQVIGVNVAEGATATDKSGRLRFFNLRSQLWWQMREALDPSSNTGIALPNDPRLLADLTAPKWCLRGSIVQVESRDEIVKRIGRSPDFASAVILAQMDTPKMAEVKRAMELTRKEVRGEYDPYGSMR